MTVKELIKILESYDSSSPVYLAYDQGTGGEVVEVFQEKDTRDTLTVYISEDVS